MIDAIEFGSHKDGTVMLDMKGANNRHIALMGKSGSGKSVAGQKILRNIAFGDECPILVFDIHRLFGSDNIYPLLIKDIEKKCNDVNVSSAGISLPMFTPLKYVGGEEEQLDVTASITDVLSSALKLGIRQKECLFQAINFVFETETYAQFGIAALNRALDAMDDEKAVDIQSKLRYILDKNIFRDGKTFIKDKKINVLRLSGLTDSAQSLIVEIVLAFIWRLANSGAFLEKGLCLFLDECQNLNWGKGGIISTILTEGRKLGLQLILITQMLKGNGKDDMSRCLLQAGNRLYFSPTENETQVIAKLIGAKRYLYWQMQLKSLSVGQCVADGSMIINEAPYKGAVKVMI